MNGPEQSDVTVSAYVPEGSILDSSVINRTPGNMRNADMMSSISSTMLSRDPNLVSGYIANEDDVFKHSLAKGFIYMWGMSNKIWAELNSKKIN